MPDRFLLIPVDQAKADPRIGQDPTIRDGFPDRQIIEDPERGQVRADPDTRPVLVDRKNPNAPVFIVAEPPDRPTIRLIETLARDIAALEAAVTALTQRVSVLEGGGRP